jgi:preprotein translocase subunit SecE
MNNLLNYLHATRGELKHVSWPTQRQTIIYTVLVIVISLVTAFYLGALDFLFARALNFILPNNG